MLHNLCINRHCPHWDFVCTLQGQIAKLQGGERADSLIKEWPRPPKPLSQALSTQQGFSHGLEQSYISSTTHLRRGFKILEDFAPWVFQSCAVVISCIFGKNTNTINSYGCCMNLMKPSTWSERAQPGLSNHVLFIFLPIQEGGQNPVSIFQQVGPPKVEKTV